MLLRSARLVLPGAHLLRGQARLARDVGGGAHLLTDVVEKLGEDAAESLGRHRAQLGRALLVRALLRRGGQLAARPAERGDAAASGGRDLIHEAVALVAQPFDLLEQHLPLVPCLHEDLLRGVLGARADLMGRAQRARQPLTEGAVELLVDRHALARDVELGLERGDALGQLADTVGERADDVIGHTETLRLVGHAVTPARSVFLPSSPRVRKSVYDDRKERQNSAIVSPSRRQVRFRVDARRRAFRVVRGSAAGRGHLARPPGQASSGGG